jgi:hypothetical protein
MSGGDSGRSSGLVETTVRDMSDPPDKPPEDASLGEKWRWMDAYDEWVAAETMRSNNDSNGEPSDSE